MSLFYLLIEGFIKATKFELLLINIPVRRLGKGVGNGEVYCRQILL